MRGVPEIQRAAGERRARLAELDQMVARGLEAAAQRVAEGASVDVAAIAAIRTERAVVADEYRVLLRAAELAARAAQAADTRAQAERFRNDPRPLQSIGGTLKTGTKALISG